MMNITKGIIFNIQRFSVHDGPGIRTTVFVKGCPLRCKWCQNPESWKLFPQLMFYPERCIGCLKCVDVCPNNAVIFKKGMVQQLWRKCQSCGKCISVCPAKARIWTGKEVTPKEVINTVLRDSPFYKNSGGGITLSGGEVLFQTQFTLEILKLSKNHGLHTVVDTSGYGPWEKLESLLPYVDLVLYDIKYIDEDKHRALTGVSNQLILANAKRVAKCVPMVVRVPIIPGCTDNKSNIIDISKFVEALTNRPRIELLPYNRLGESKYPRLGYVYSLSNLIVPSQEKMGLLRMLVEDEEYKRI